MSTNPGRERDFTLAAAGWTLNYAGIPLSRSALKRLCALPQEHGLGAAVESLFSARPVNSSEGRPALHMALRAGAEADWLDAGTASTVSAQRQRFLAVADELHSGQRGLSDLLHIGIGGSDLGPRLVADALNEDDSAVRVHWLSTLDGRRFERLCRRLDPQTTGMVIASKSFSTEETLIQAAAVRDWLGQGWSERSWAVSARADRATGFGLPPGQVLGIPDSVGGRFSLWSAIGMSAAALIGRSAFEQLLAGARQADDEFRAQPDAAVMAVMLALQMHFLRRELNLNTLGFVSYEPRLALLADYLQQLLMESLGKGVTAAGQPLGGASVPLVFGGTGTNLQHSIFQALHQGTDDHPLVLVGALEADHDHPDWQRRQLAHLLAQARVLRDGEDADETFRRLPGKRPVATLLADRLDAGRLGWLLASFEHAVYTLAMLWGLNPFDQWGVEAGKRLAARIHRDLD